MCCSAQELSELLTKLLNKMYTQQDFQEAEPTGLSMAAADPFSRMQPSSVPNNTLVAAN